jgi:hypothetical protein
MSTLQNTKPAEYVDLARIEAEAHRLRAEAMRDGFAWVGARIAALWSRTRTEQPRAV